MVKQICKWMMCGSLLLGLSGIGMAQIHNQARIGEGQTLRPKRTETAPVIDGVLDDAVWQNGPIVNEPFVTNTPVYGDRLPQKTEVYLSYDNKNIYIAYHCFDDHPENLRATMTKRDNIMQEDWIDVDIDTFGTRQLTYLHACNPLGVQCDLVISATGGQSLDPDWVWYSAGKIVSDGYIVEVQIPLKSLRYKGGREVRMNMGFYRFVSHSGANASWPQESQKLGYFNSLVPVIFEDLPNQLRLEALPAVTFSSTRDRQTPDSWRASDTIWQAGLDLKYGVTPTSNLDLTINPDFSQVETDQMQVQVNQRYPVFFSEKRPFFMEVGNLFSVAGANGAGNMISAVHTRTIIDPAWGAKFTGDFSKFSLGILAAGDELPGRELTEGASGYDRNSTVLFTRAKYLLGGDNFFGLLYTGRELGDDYNRVVAIDSHIRLQGGHSFDVNGMFSFSNEAMEKTEGHAATLAYNYNQRPLGIDVIAEDYGRDFRMDSSFYNRNGFTCLAAYVTPRIYPKWNGLPWLRRMALRVGGNFTHDKNSGGDDFYLSTTLIINTLLQGTVQVGYTRYDEYWAGRNFVQNRGSFIVYLQPRPWITTSFNISYGEAVNYQEAFLGHRLNLNLGLNLRLGSKLRQDLSYTYQDFNRADDGRSVYDINILVSRTTYQANKSLFFRSLIQYNTFTRRVLTDLLASFTLIPGTVMHVGYGLLHESTSYDPEQQRWKRDLIDTGYYNLRQSFFAKISYRWQF